MNYWLYGRIYKGEVASGKVKLFGSTEGFLIVFGVFYMVLYLALEAVFRRFLTFSVSDVTEFKFM